MGGRLGDHTQAALFLCASSRLLSTPILPFPGFFTYVFPSKLYCMHIYVVTSDPPKTIISAFTFMIPVYLGNTPEILSQSSASLPVWHRETSPSTAFAIGTFSSASPRPGIPFNVLRVLIANFFTPMFLGCLRPLEGGTTRAGTSGLLSYLHPRTVETTSPPTQPHSQDPASPGMWFSPGLAPRGL